MLRISFIFILFASICFSADYGKVSSQKIADDVYLFTTTPYGVGLSGNSVAILGDSNVLIFDSNGLPPTAETILAEVRKMTDKPVQYLVNSHWHWDHWGGNEVYQKAFPGLKIISHEKTREQMVQVEPRWNDEGLQTGLPGYLKQLDQNLATAKKDHKPDSEIKDLEDLIKAGKNFLVQKTSLTKTYPNVTFSESMTISQGQREIQILHARAITVGDTYVYLPKEKIVITGDILLSPYPYAIGGTYPTDWLKTLEKLESFHPSIIVPGHGNVQDQAFLKKNIDLFRTLLQQVKDAKAKGLSLEQSKDLIGKQSIDLASKLSITDPQVAMEFKAYFLDVFVVRAFKELDNPLGDLPDGLG
jgi:cyclase